MERYEVYKDSRVDWLDEIPVGWGIVSLKWKSHIYAGGTPHKDRSEYWLDGTIPWLNSGAVNQFVITEPSNFITEEGFRNSSAKWIEKESIVIALAGQGKTKGMAAIATFRTTCNQSLSAIQPASDIDSRYLLYYLRANYLNIRGLAGEGKRDGLNLEMIGGIPISVPPLDEQIAIANFLDRKTAEIDALIAQKERLLELYEEEKTAIINHAVTKGIDPSAELKDSGVEWLGEIPVGWKLKNLKYVTKHGLQNGIFKKATDFGSGIKLINVGDIYTHNFLIDENSLERVVCTASEITKYEVNTGDIFFVRSSLKREGIAKTACLEGRNESIVFECHLIKITPKDIVHQYLNYYLNSDLLRHKLISLSITTTMSTISQDAIGSLEVIIPSSKEQTAIVQYIKTETARIDAKIAKTQRIIELQKEYRTALISEAVTGKIKVPESSTQEASA